jgi:hypothetical protein
LTTPLGLSHERDGEPRGRSDHAGQHEPASGR